jgi:hypothetical protein
VSDGAFLFREGECVRFCVDSITVVDPSSAIKFDLKFLEGLNHGILGFHKHDSLALFVAYFSGSLNVDELFSGYEISFSEDGLEGHALGAVVDHECSDHAFFSYKHGSEIKICGLGILVIDYVARVVD